MSFQKCPKCNGEGRLKTGPVQRLPGSTDPTTGEINYVIVQESQPCPLCLGEFVIHEEQGVPPSKAIRAVNPMLQFTDELSLAGLKGSIAGEKLREAELPALDHKYCCLESTSCAYTKYDGMACRGSWYPNKKGLELIKRIDEAEPSCLPGA